MDNAGNNKRIEFKFTVDQNSLQKAKTAIREITSEVTKLVEATQRASQSLGGIGSLFTAKSNVPGVPQKPDTTTQKLSGFGGAVAQGVVSQANVLKSAVQGSKEALKQMVDNQRSSVSQAVQELEKLRQKVIAVNQEYRSLAAAGDTRGAGRARNALSYHEEQFDAAQRNLRTLRAGAAPLGGIDSAFGPMASTDWGMDPFTGGPVKTPPGRWQRFKNAMHTRLWGKEYHDEAGNPKAGGGLSDLYQSLYHNPYARTAGIAVAGLAAVGRIGTTYFDQQIAATTDMGRRQAALGGTFGNIALGVRGGDVKFLAAMRSMARNDEKWADMQGIGAQQGMREGKALAETVGSPIRSIGSGVIAAAGGGVSNLDRKLFDAQMEAKLAMANRVQQEIQSDPLKYQYYDTLTQSAQSRMDLMRALGHGQARVRNKTTGAIELRNTAADRAQRYLDRGIDAGQIVSAQSSLESLLGLRLGQRHAGTVLNANIGHFRGAENIIAASAMAGRNPTDLLRAISFAGGDPGIASRLGQTIAGQMMSGASPTGGYGLLGALTEFGTSSNPAEAMRIQNQLSMGVGLSQNFLQGKTDGYQSGRNLLSAISALGPGGSLFGQEYLAGKMSFGQMADIMGGGSVTPIMKSLGIGEGAVKQFGQSTIGSILDRFVSNGDNSSSSTFARNVLSSGGNVNKYIRGLKGGQQQQALTDFAAILLGGGLADSDEGALGMARSIAGLGSKAGKGRKGFADAAAGSKEAVVVEGLAQNQRDFNEWLATSNENFKQMYGGLVQFSKTISSWGQNVAMSSTELVGAFGRLAVATDSLSESLDKTGTLKSANIAREATSDDLTYQVALRARANDPAGKKELMRQRSAFMDQRAAEGRKKTGTPRSARLADEQS